VAPIFDGHLLAGVLTELFGSARGVSMFVIPVCMGLGHAFAVLANPTASRIRRWTAAGFVVGVAVTILVVLVDLILEGR
jgi:hypothetical protein